MMKITVYDENEKDSVENAFVEFSEFWKLGMSADYKKYEAKELEQLLGMIGKNLGTNGALHLINSPRRSIPTDCYIDLVLKPTYVAGAVYIHAYNMHPEWFSSGCHLENLVKILEACLERGLYDHGYEAEGGKLDNMLIFARAGVKIFLTKHPKECDGFCNFLSEDYKLLSEDYANSKAENREFCILGFGKIVADEEAKAIIELI